MNNLSLPQIFPLFSLLFIFGLGLLILLKNPKIAINRLFFLITLVFSVWQFGTFMMFVSKIAELQIFWDRFIYLGVVFMPAFQYHFSLIITHINKRRKKMLYIAYFLSFIFLFLSRSDYFASDIFIYKWGVHTQARILHHFFLGFFFFYIFALLFNFYLNYKNTILKAEKYKMIYFVISFAILNLVGGTGYLPAYKISFYPISLVAPFIFSILIAYAIARHQLFNVKVIAVELLTFASWIILITEVSMADAWKDRIIEGILLVFMIIFGIFLIRSVSGEISRREKTEKLVSELREANEKLRELDQIKSDFISIASHQLRTPLTAIKGYTSMLLEGVYGDVPIKARGIVDKIFQSSQRLVYIVNDMLDVTRIEGGRLKYDFEDVRLVNLVSDVVEELRQNASRKKLKFNFHVDVEDADIIIFADPNKTRQAITNLIDNSIKYTNAGFVFVFISKSEDGKDAILAIKDSGLGMTPDTLNVIFNKFFRAKGALKSHTEGSGLGLYVAREIIRANNGDVWAESEGQGRGSQFYIKLPIKKG